MTAETEFRRAMVASSREVATMWQALGAVGAAHRARQAAGAELDPAQDGSDAVIPDSGDVGTDEVTDAPRVPDGRLVLTGDDSTGQLLLRVTGITGPTEPPHPTRDELQAFAHDLNQQTGGAPSHRVGQLADGI